MAAERRRWPLAWRGAALAMLWLSGSAALAGGRPPESPRLEGDVGAAAMRSSPAIQGLDASWSAIPYVWADYGRWFARVDTVGLKTLDIGRGALEVAGRVGSDDFDPADSPVLRGMAARHRSAWLGVGTFQRTPYGGWFVHVFRDVAASKGHWLDVTYAGRTAFGRITAYPSIGFDWLDARYTRHYFGTRSADAPLPSGVTAYQPGAALRPKVGLLLDVPLADQWHVLTSWRGRYRPDTLAHSPLSDGRVESTLMLAVAYRFR